ncbi:MAG: winged helix DNA-binding protein [Chloroflexi bacterium]|nr:winged helix DNA-binding protein [Chloroflexota bacterium]
MKSKTKNLRTLTTEDELYDLWILLSRTRHAFYRARQKELAQYGISVREAGVLYVIDMLGQKATPTEIARWFIQEPHSVSELVSRMEKRDLVRKAKDLARRNLVRVELTDKGKEALRYSLKRETVHSIMAALSASERHQLAGYLKTIRDKALEEFDKR